MSPEEPDDLRYSSTGAGLLDRLRGMTNSLPKADGSPRLGHSEAAAGLGIGAAAATGLAIGTRHDGTDPFSDVHETQAARYGPQSPVLGGDRQSSGSEGSYPHGSNENSGGASSGVEEAVQFGSASEGSAESVPQRRGMGSNVAWWGGQQPPQGAAS